MGKPRLLRVTTVPISLHVLLHGQLGFMQREGFELLTVSADGKEVDAIRNMGIRHAVVPFTRKITPFQDFICLIRLVFVILKFRPQIVHSHTPKAGLLGMLAARLCGIPVRMHTVAGLPMMEATALKRTVLKLAEKITYRCAGFIYPNSKGLQSYIMKEFNYRPGKFKVLGEGSTNGIDVNHFRAGEALSAEALQVRFQHRISPQAFCFSFVGRVVKDKGVCELVEAFGHVQKMEREVWLFLIGDFEDDIDPLPSAVKHQLSTNPHIICPGFQRDIRPWVVASDAFVLPSYREGFPNAVLQAGSLEKPSIVSDINGCNEIVMNDQTGVLVPPKNVLALQKAMLRLLQNRAEGIQMGIEARKFIATRFSHTYIWNEILREYKKNLALCT